GETILHRPALGPAFPCMHGWIDLSLSRFVPNHPVTIREAVMTQDYLGRIRHKGLLDRVVSAEQAASLIRDGMVLGMSGFTRAGEAKAVPMALAERAKAEPLKVTLMTGASLGNDLDKTLAE